MNWPARFCLPSLLPAHECHGIRSEVSTLEANRKPTVLFSGFNKADKAEMEAHAVAHGLKPVSTVTKKLECLVLGDTPGEKKVMNAGEMGIKTLHAHEYLQLYGDR